MLLSKEEFLRLVSAKCTGSSLLLYSNRLNEMQVSYILNSLPHRVVDVKDPKAFDGKMITVIKGVENLSEEEFSSLVQKLESARLRHAMIIPISRWFIALPSHLLAFDRFDKVDVERFKRVCSLFEIIGF